MKVSNYPKVPMPDEVRQVIKGVEGWLENPTRETVYDLDFVKETYFWANADVYDGETQWSVGPNVEDGMPAAIFYNDQWYWRGSYDGTDRPMKGGQQEAIDGLIMSVAP